MNTRALAILLALLTIGPEVLAFDEFWHHPRHRRHGRFRIAPAPSHIQADHRERGVEGRWRKRLETPWTSASSIATADNDLLLAVADADNDAVAVIDAQTLERLHHVKVCQQPERLVVGPDKKTAYVTCRLGRAVARIDVRSGTEVGRASAGVEPYGLALTPNGRELLVTASASGELLALDSASLRVRWRLAVPDGWPAAVAVAPDGRRAYVSHLYGGRIEVVNLDRRRLERAFELPRGDAGLPGRLLGRAFETKRVPNQAFAMSVTPGGTKLLVPHTMVDTGSNRSAGGVRAFGYGPGIGGIIPLVPSVSALDLTAGGTLQRQGKTGMVRRARARRSMLLASDRAIQDLAQPIAVAMHPTHSLAFVVGKGGDSVVALDMTTRDPMVRVKATLKTGAAPRGIAFSSDGQMAWVHDSHDYAVSAFDLSGLMGVAPSHVVSRRRPPLAERTVFATSPLPPRALQGRRLFTRVDRRIGGSARFACASCHPDGRHDGLVWSNGAGPRQTPILAGNLAGTAPFNWLGTEQKLADNVAQTIRRLGGKGITNDEVEALALFIREYLPGLDNPHQRERAEPAVQLGRALFHDPKVGCSGCHDSGGGVFTDGDSHDIGTTTERERIVWKNRKNLRGLREAIPKPPVAYDTPTLRNVWASAPYLHDGSARTLAELLTVRNPGDRMGHTSHLSPHELGALEAYLRTL